MSFVHSVHALCQANVIGFGHAVWKAIAKAFVKATLPTENKSLPER